MNIKMSKIILHIFCLFIGLIFGYSDNTRPAWVEELNYKETEIHPISLNWVHEPLVPVRVNGVEFKVKFDTGNSKGFSLTNAVEDKIDCTVIGTATEYFADGSYRGKSKIIKIRDLEFFGEQYKDIETTLADWKMYGVVKFNGLLGLKYFRYKRVTLDYKNKKIAISEQPIIYDDLDKSKFIIVSLLNPPTRQEDLIYFMGEVNDQESAIYLDTGSSRSFVDHRVLKEDELPEEGIPERKRKSKLVKLKIAGYPFEFRNIRIKKIERGTHFEFPVRFKIGADILKDFTITIDKIDQRLIIHQDSIPCMPGSINKYLHKNAVIGKSPSSDLFKHTERKPISVEEAICFAVRRFKEKGIKNIKICESRWWAAPLGGYLIDAKGSLTSGNKHFSIFRLGVCDGSDVRKGRWKTGEEFVFIALGKDSNGNSVWLPEPGPDYELAEGEGLTNGHLAYEFLPPHDRKNFESIPSRYK